jgi:hypothetical protein
MKFNKETISTLGMSKLASGTITTPVAYLDLELPEGYASFNLQFLGIQSDLGSSLGADIAAVISLDGGATFIHDPTNEDSYIILSIGKDQVVSYVNFAG